LRVACPHEVLLMLLKFGELLGYLLEGGVGLWDGLSEVLVGGDVAVSHALSTSSSILKLLELAVRRRRAAARTLRRHG